MYGYMWESQIGLDSSSKADHTLTEAFTGKWGWTLNGRAAIPGHQVSISMPSWHQFWSWSLLWRLDSSAVWWFSPTFRRWDPSLDSNASTLPSCPVGMSSKCSDCPTPSLYHLRVAFSVSKIRLKQSVSSMCHDVRRRIMAFLWASWAYIQYMCLCSEDGAIVELSVIKLLRIRCLNIHTWRGVQTA